MATEFTITEEDTERLLKTAAQTPAAAKYTVKRVAEEIAATRNPEKWAPFYEHIQNFGRIIELSFLPNPDAWLKGKPGNSSSFLNLQANLAKEAVGALASTNIGEKDVTFHFAINDQAQFLRGYTSDGNAVDPQQVDALDKLQTTWLAKNKIVSKDGFLYEADEKGDAKKDNKNKDVKADAAKVRELIGDQGKGLGQFMASEAKITLTCQEQEYPAQVEPAPQGQGMGSGSGGGGV